VDRTGLPMWVQGAAIEGLGPLSQPLARITLMGFTGS
jgi:hypothetical protein